MATGTVTLHDYITAVLEKLNLPATSPNIAVFSALAASEGRGLAGWNPFDTTQREPGSTAFNSVGVQSYPTFQEGVAATAATLNNGLYDPLLTGLSEQQPASFYTSGPGFVSLKTWQRGPNGANTPAPAWVRVLGSRSVDSLVNYAKLLTQSSNAAVPAATSTTGAPQLAGAASGSLNPLQGIGDAFASAVGNATGVLQQALWIGLGFALFAIGLFLIFARDLEDGVEKVTDIAEKVAPVAAA